MLGREKYVKSSGLDRHLLHLVKIRASQINGCAYCLDMHMKEAWTEALTKLRGVPDDVYDQAHAAFSDVELANLSLAIVAINGWNRRSIASRSPEPGTLTVPKS